MKHKKKLNLLLALALGVTPFLTSLNTSKSYANEIETIIDIEKDNIISSYGTGSSFGGNGGNYYKYFTNSQWVKRESGWTLSITPTSYLRSRLNGDEARLAFEIIYNTHKNDKLWKNTESMREQFMCHFWNTKVYAKQNWNIEPWRTSINSLTCN